MAQCGSPDESGRREGKRLIYVGDPLTAGDAHAWGLIDQIVPAGQAVDDAVALAQRLAAKPHQALAAAKQAIAEAYAVPASD